MAATYRYLFEGKTIGNNSNIRFDTINIPEMMFIITKKMFGIPNTIPDLIYSSEYKPDTRNNTGNAFPSIYQNKIFSQDIPQSNPMGIRSLFSPINAILDDSWSNYNYSPIYGINICNDNLSKRYFSKTHPYICYYSNLLLSPLTNYFGRFSGSLYRTIPTYLHPLLINSISARHDFTYYIQMYQSDGITPIEPNDGFPLIDNDTGIVIFYDSNTLTRQVTPSNLPRISFYRYEGLFGEASILKGQDL